MSPPKFTWSFKDVIAEKRVTKNEIDELRKWMNSQNYPEVSEEMITTFIIACERDIKMSKSTVKAYFSIKKTSPEIFDDRDINREDLKSVYETVNVAILPLRTPDNYAIHMAKLKNTNYRNFDFTPMIKLSFMVCDVSLNLKTPPSGVILVMDAEGIGFMHLTRVSLTRVKVVLEFLHHGFQMKLKGIHIVNANAAMKHLMFLLRPFIASEVYNYIHLYTRNSTEELWNHIPKECFLKEYGGEIDSTLEELSLQMLDKYKDCQEFYREEEDLRKKWKSNNS